jgi:hypothetical protein
MTKWIINLFTFRNSHHLYWFLFTSFVLLINAGHVFCSFDFSLFIKLPIMIILHLLVVARAIQVVLIEKRIVESLSKDCIWYNSLIAFLYLVLFFISFYKGEFLWWLNMK